MEIESENVETPVVTEKQEIQIEKTEETPLDVPSEAQVEASENLAVEPEQSTNVFQQFPPPAPPADLSPPPTVTPPEEVEDMVAPRYNEKNEHIARPELLLLQQKEVTLISTSRSVVSCFCFFLF
jgi:hypothetical protein